MSPGFRIGIVGGGPGGLLTAYHLQKYTNRRIDITVLEASERLGGKILTPTFSHSKTTYEAGAAEFYDYSEIDDDPLKELIRELGLFITRMEGSSVIMKQQVLANLDDVERHLGRPARQALLTFDRQSRDLQTPNEFYYSDDPLQSQATHASQSFTPAVAAIADPCARRFLETLIHSDLATEPDKTSLGYGIQNYLMNDPRYMRLYSIEGGNERLIRELIARTQAQFLLRQSIREVGLGQSGQIRVRTVAGDTTVDREFDCVVLALPHQALSRLTFEGELLSSAMRGHLKHYDHPAHYLRITALFDRPFWRGSFPDSFCMLDQFGGCCLYDESLRNPGAREGVLGWLIAGENAERMSSWDDASLIEAALDSLPGFLQHGRAHFQEARVHRWIGAVNAWPGGRSFVTLERRHQPEPTRHPNLFVVGDYLFDSTLNGVLDSADYVAQRLATSLNERGTL